MTALALFLALTAQPLRVGGEVKAPVAIKRVNPDYSKIKIKRVSGVLVLEAIVTRDGTVRDVRVIRGDDNIARAAVAALRQWRFKPATRNGEPVDVYFNFTVNLCPR